MGSTLSVIVAGVIVLCFGTFAYALFVFGFGYVAIIPVVIPVLFLVWVISRARAQHQADAVFAASGRRAETCPRCGGQQNIRPEEASYVCWRCHENVTPGGTPPQPQP
jgi:hypothetical protein